MKLLLTTLSIIISSSVFGQDFEFPTIDQYGKDISSFIPLGWTLLDSTRGDLNNDNLTDIALVIQHKDSVSITKKEFEYEDTVLTQPRILIIAFYNSTTKRYELIEQNNTFILNHDIPNREDPYHDISINTGILKIDFHIFMNMGGWGMSENTYKFRYQGNDFVLIGADYYYAKRNTGETENRSYNFLTKKVKIEKGNLSSDKQNVKWRKFELPTLKTLKTFKQPFTWEVEKDYYL
jgi:hypothetical protein